MLSQSNTATFLPGLARFALAVQLASPYTTCRVWSCSPHLAQLAGFGAAYPAWHGLSHPAPARLTHFPTYGQELTSSPGQSGDNVRLTYFYRKEQRK